MLVLGIAIGWAMGWWWRVGAYFRDVVTIMLALPAFIWALLAAMWWGFSEVGPIVVPVLAATPMLVASTYEGAKALPKPLIEMSSAYRIPKARFFGWMVLPAMSPYIFAGFRYAVLAGWGALSLVEFFASNWGAGYRAAFWYDAGNFNGLMGWGLIEIVVILAVDRLVLERLAPARGVGRKEPKDGEYMATLVADHVNKVYEATSPGQSATHALDDFGFEASGHTFICLVGPSGCGKSTFLNLVSGVEKPTSGSVTVTGEGKSARIGYVFQDPRLLPWRTVLDNMIYVHDDGDRKTRRERCMRFLEMVDLAHAADKYPSQLSGGMRQRIGIARALSIEPDLLLMDEPFSHLDAITARSLRTELQQLWQASGATVLFVTHDVNEAVQLSDRILMMNKGGTLYADIPIGLPRPRLMTDRDVVTQQADVLALFENMRAEPVDAETEGVNH